MSNYIYVQGIDVPIQICSYKRSKSIKIYVKDGFAKVTKPVWYSKKNTLVYIEKNKQAINELYRNNILRRTNNSLLSQDYLLYFGEKYKLNIVKEDVKERYSINEKENIIDIYIPSNTLQNQLEEMVKEKIYNMYKEEVKNVLHQILHKYCELMKIAMPKYRIKNCKTIWGSCSQKGNLNFNLKLAMLPVSIIEHIVVHELCHLKHMNHSTEFWNLVYTYVDKEEYALGKKWIKENVKFNI